MNENKTAITELIEWMENEDALVEEKRIDFLYLRILDKAKALESSQAEKDKGLVEELESRLNIAELQLLGKDLDQLSRSFIEDRVRAYRDILSRHQPNPIDPDYNKNKVAMNGHGIPVCPECGTKIEACGDCADYAEFKAWKVPAPKPEAKTGNVLTALDKSGLIDKLTDSITDLCPEVDCDTIGDKIEEAVFACLPATLPAKTKEE